MGFECVCPPDSKIKYSVFYKLKCCFTSTENVGLLGTGAQDDHLDFHTALELRIVCFWLSVALRPQKP